MISNEFTYYVIGFWCTNNGIYAVEPCMPSHESTHLQVDLVGPRGLLCVW